MSSNSPRECFVYITLPGKVSAITAGKFVLNQTGSGTPLGRFVYGQSYLQNREAVAIDPIELRLSNTTYSTVHLKGVFGACAMPVLTTGDAASSKGTLVRRCWEKWTTSLTRLTTVRARSDLGLTVCRPLPSENSINRSTSPNFRGSPTP
jgi:hypothetical protein